MKRLLILAVLLSLTGKFLLAQGELDEQQKAFFRNEQSFGIQLNTDGIGVSYRAAKRLDFRNKNLIEIDFGTLRNQKEYKQSNASASGGSYVYGKMNSTFYLRAGFGHQHEMFKKADLGGIAIRYFYSAGPVLAIYKPIYYKVIYYINQNTVEIKDEKFDASMAIPQDIYSKSAFTKGLDETKVMPGVFGKGGFNFEYSKEDKFIHAIEVGAQINAFPTKIPIMAGNNNKSVLFSLFVSYRFGIIIDPLDPDSNKLSNIFRRKKSE